MNNIEKPPIGLKPKFYHNYSRYNDIMKAIIRYINSQKEIPVEWIEEYNELLIGLKKD